MSLPISKHNQKLMIAPLLKSIKTKWKILDDGGIEYWRHHYIKQSGEVIEKYWKIIQSIVTAWIAVSQHSIF